MSRYRFFRLLLATLLLLMAIVSCNFPANKQQTSTEAQTAVAQTVEALLAAAASPFPSSLATPTFAAASNTPTISTSATLPTATPTYSTPMLTVNESTNCRAGPGQDYEILTVVFPGQQAEILGYYPPLNYWLIKTAVGETCWLWGEHAITTGSYWVVPTLTVPPTQTSTPPLAPILKRWDYFCTYNGNNNDLNITIVWNDRANNETGYRIYRNDRMVAELPVDATTYNEIVAVNTGEQLTYRVEVFNPSGSASTTTFSVACQ
jgi:hypothetical protein